LPQKLDALEEEKQRLMTTLNSPAFYERRDAVEINKASDRLEVVEKELDEAYRRWDELEKLTAKFGGEPG
jgi:ATP-binding cassette subfamily F protein uup